MCLKPASEPPAGNAYLWLVGTLALGVGLPFFCVSASAPLLQTWFARSGHPQAHDPYFLYAASNLGSLLALLSYPFVVEPWSGVAMQSVVWMWAFVVLLGGMALCATSARASNADARGAERGLVPAEVPGRWVERLHWTALAFVPSGLLVAFSTHITTDVASAPLLWVLPLAAFLLTFVLVFRERPVLPHGIVLAVQPVLVILALGGMAVPGHLTHVIGTFAGAVCFFVTMLVAHRELYLKRPEPGRLTEFYLWMSFGGVLGGMFAALLAPQIFSRNWEYVLLLTLGMACRPWDVARCRAERDLRETVIAFIVVAGSIAVAAFAFGAKWLPASHGASVMVGSLVVLGALAVAAWKQPVRQLACIVAILATVVLLPSRLSSGHSERSFFGVHRVYESADGTYRLLSHGTTVHGAQRIAETGGRPTPLTYYHPHGPIAFGIEAARSATVGRSREFSVGVVGLGAGSVACYHRAGEKWSFYEIDPVVVRMARDPHLFTFLSKCQPNARIVLGDARLTLAHVPAGGFDHLLIDAFSSAGLSEAQAECVADRALKDDKILTPLLVNIIFGDPGIGTAIAVAVRAAQGCVTADDLKRLFP